jgi:hypothetical protein
MGALREVQLRKHAFQMQVILPRLRENLHGEQKRASKSGTAPAEVFLGSRRRGIAEHRAAIPTNHRRADAAEHGGQASSAGFTRKGKFLAKTALPAGGNGDAQFEFVSELGFTIVAVNLASISGRFTTFVQALDGRVL